MLLFLRPCYTVTMAKLILKGNVADVELISDPVDDQVIALCARHPSDEPWRVTGRCSWTERYDDLGDATEYAADHADTGRMA